MSTAMQLDARHTSLAHLSTADHLCLLTYKCFHAMAPPYLSQLCQPLSAVSNQSQLCPADMHQLFIYATIDASASWNALPPLLRDPDLSLSDFRPMLKTVLFC